MPTSTPGSSNPFPSVLFVEGAAPATPASGKQRLFVDVADGLLKLKDDAGTVTAVGGAGGVADLDALLALSSGQDTSDALTGAAAPDAGNVFATMADLPAPGGGGLAQSYVGYNTIGGTWTTVTGGRLYAKKVTLSATSLIVSVDVHIRASTDNFVPIYAGLLSDNAGVPNLLIAASASAPMLLSSGSSGGPWAGRWLSVPLGAYVTAADYWLVAAFPSVAYFDMANDGSGSDVYWGLTGAYISGSHASLAKTTSSVKNSIRASILS